MILTTTFLIITVLVILLIVDKCAEAAAVDVTLKMYHNDTTICSAGISGVGCDFKFTMVFEGVSSSLTYKTVVTTDFTADASNNINFKTGNDALKSGVFNPITINLNSVEDLKMKVNVVDADYLFDDKISDFTMNLDIKGKSSNVEHLVKHTTAQGSGQFQISYKVYCDGNHGGIGCCGCINNYYNTNCTKFCQPINNFTCDSNGDHICKPNYYNTSCNVHCVPTSQYNCSRNGTRGCLGRWTGDKCDVQTPCPSGKFGMNCSVNCTAVPNQYTCNSTTGEKVCEGHWTGSECDSCSPNYYGVNCNTFCQASSAMNCSDTGEKECLGHFTGQNCSLCETGWYGSGCDLYCDLNSTLWTCDDHGSHICNGKRTGTDCTDCKEGWFGEDCSVECTDTEKYKCTDQGDKTCTSNWNGRNCDRCKEMYFGPNCTCKREPGRAECDNEGVLHCLDPWAGPKCDICNPGYSGPQCSQPDKNPFNRIKVLGKVVYFFLVALVSVLLAVICTFTITVLRKPTKKSLARIRTGIRKNKIFDQGIDDDNKPIMKNKGKMVFIEDM